MTDGLINIASTGISQHAGLDGGQPSGETFTNNLRTAIGWLPIAVFAVVALAALLFSQTQEEVGVRPTNLAVAAAKPTTGLAKEASFNPATSEAIVPDQPAPVDRLTISSQSWRRGGLGSNAFVTMTLRNDNNYAVKDIDVACAFLRPDGRRLTERSRVINDVINMKSRKTFTRLHVGFVNVNAAKARCSLVAASHI